MRLCADAPVIITITVVLVASLLMCGSSFSSSYRRRSTTALLQLPMSRRTRSLFCSPPQSQTQTSEVMTTDLSTAVRNGTPITWRAQARSSVRVKEGKRTSEAYMALPASQYSILSAEQVIRLSDTDFKIVLGTLNFFGTKIAPILYASVDVYPKEAKSVIKVIRAETVGSDMALAVNGTFSISAVNVVTAEVNEKGHKTLNSNTTLVIDVLVPRSRFPMSIIQSGGNFIMQSSLNIIVPTFVRILAADFKRWSDGDDERDALEGAKLDLQ